jgi:hypothetical protein
MNRSTLLSFFLALGTVSLAVPSCSLLLRDEPVQCSTDDDCTSRGFRGWRCESGGVCVDRGSADAALLGEDGSVEAAAIGDPEASVEVGAQAPDAGEDAISGELDGGGAGGDVSTSSRRDADAAPGPESGARDASVSDGSFDAQRLYCNLTALRGIALFNGKICWVGDVSPRRLFCAPASGGPSANIVHIDQVADMPFLSGAFDLLVNDTFVFWSNGPGNQVIRRPLAGGQPQQYFTGGGRVSFLAFGTGATIWATDFAEPPASAAGEVIVGPTGTGTSSNAIYNAEIGASGVAVNGGYVYWGSSDLRSAASLNFGPLTGGATINRILSPEQPVGGVAVDAQGTAYFLAGNGSLYRYATGAAAPQLMYKGTSAFGMGDVAVDDQSVYFSEPGLGCIMIVQK